MHVLSIVMSNLKKLTKDILLDSQHLSYTHDVLRFKNFSVSTWIVIRMKAIKRCIYILYMPSIAHVCKNLRSFLRNQPFNFDYKLNLTKLVARLKTRPASHSCLRSIVLNKQPSLYLFVTINIRQK